MSATETSPLHTDELRLSAIAVSRGVGIGQAVFLPAFEVRAEHHDLDDETVGNELDRLSFAVGRSRESLEKLAHADSKNGSIAGIFDAHLLILESFVARVEDLIRTKRVNSEWAIDQVLQEALARHTSGPETHLQEKQLDLKDVAATIIQELRDTGRVELPPGSVIVTREIRPSAVMDLARTSPAAFVTQRGGWTSHSSILARELGIPMVTGVDIRSIRPGDIVIADGFSGEITIRPVGRPLGAQTTSKAGDAAVPAPVSENTRGSMTLDGVAVQLRVNAESSNIYDNAKRAGALGIGLFRSESLVNKSGKVPSEEQQFGAYSAIADAANPDLVNIRTFDIGPDFVDGNPGTERNPSLGLRSIRLSLARPELLRTQLRAIVRANKHGNLAVVIPLVSGLSEVRQFREALDEAVDSASNDRTDVPRIGAMIEVPSAVLTAREIANEVDFLCLGTNDLVQYLLAVDRDNERVTDWYQTLHPAVLRAISEVVKAARDAEIPVTVCGEMAGSLFYIPLLIGLGVRDLSMSANSIAPARQLINGISALDAEAFAIEVLRGKTASEIDSVLRQHYLSNWPHLFPESFLDLKHS